MTRSNIFWGHENSATHVTRIHVAEKCGVELGKPLAVPWEPPLSKNGFAYKPSSTAGGMTGVTEKCPLGSWVVNMRVKSHVPPADRMGIVGECACHIKLCKGDL